MPSLTDRLASWIPILEPLGEGAAGHAAEVNEAWRFHAFCGDSPAPASRNQEPVATAALWMENAVLGRAWLALPLGVTRGQEDSGQLASLESLAAPEACERSATTRRADSEHAALLPAHLARGGSVAELSIVSELATCLSPSQVWWLPEMRLAPSIPPDVQQGWHQERAVLVHSLLRTRRLIADGLHWMVVPCSLWSLAARVLTDETDGAARGLPPVEVLDDWVAQWSHLQSQCPSATSLSALPNPLDTLLSRYGWLCSLSPLCESLSQLLQLDRDPDRVQAWIERNGIAPRIVHWPSSPNSEHNVAPKPAGERSKPMHARLALPDKLEPTAQSSEARASSDDDFNAVQTNGEPLVLPDRSPKRAKLSSPPLPTNRQRALLGALAGVGLLASIAIAMWLSPRSSVLNREPLAESPSAKPRPTVMQPSSTQPSTTPPSAEGRTSNGEASASSGRAEADPPAADPAVSHTELGANAEEPLAITKWDTLDASSRLNEGPTPISPSLTGLLADLDRRIAREMEPRSSVDAETKHEEAASTEDLPTEITTDSIVERSIATDAQPSAAIGLPSGSQARKALFPADPLDNRPSPQGEVPAPGDAVVAPDAADVQSNLTHRIPLRLGIQRLDARVGKGVHAKLAFAVARLRMAEDALPEVQIVPSDEVTLTGAAISEWRVAIEDAQPELIVRLSSRPNAKWPLAVQVGVQISPLQDPMPLGPNDAANVLQNLALYRTWLERTIDSLSTIPSPPRAFGGPDRIALLRHYRAQWKDTEKAIDAWRVVQRLSSELFQYATVEIQLQPQPAAGETP